MKEWLCNLTPPVLCPLFSVREWLLQVSDEPYFTAVSLPRLTILHRLNFWVQPNFHQDCFAEIYFETLSLGGLLLSIVPAFLAGSQGHTKLQKICLCIEEQLTCSSRISNISPPRVKSRRFEANTFFSAAPLQQTTRKIFLRPNFASSMVINMHF